LVHAPMLAEKLGVMRAQGAGFLAAGELPPQGKGMLLVLQQRVAELQGSTFRSFERALVTNADFRQTLAGTQQSVQKQVQQTLALAERELVSATALTLASKDYFDNFTSTIDALYAFNGQAMASLDQALQARVTDLQRSLLW